jgi:hypothetical protein
MGVFAHCVDGFLEGVNRMTRTMFAAAAILSCLCAGVARADDPTMTILVPAGTPVKVHIVGTLSSKDAKDDQTFPIAAAEDVVINGMVVIPKGAGGEGVVKKVDGARGSGHSGSLQLVMNYLHSADGGKIALTSSVQNQSEDDRKARRRPRPSSASPPSGSADSSVTISPAVAKRRSTRKRS